MKLEIYSEFYLNLHTSVNLNLLLLKLTYFVNMYTCNF